MTALPSKINPPVRYNRDLRRGLGSFWQDVFEGKNDLDALLDSAATLQRQVDLDTELASESVGRKTLPAFQAYRVKPLRLAEPDLQVFRRDLVYGAESDLVYSTNADAHYSEAGSSADTAEGKEWPGPFRLKIKDGLYSVAAIGNRPSNPDKTLIFGADYRIVQNQAGYWLEFEDNPFRSDFQIRHDVNNNRNTVLWLWRAQYDRSLPYRHFGWLPGLADNDIPSKRELKLVNAAWDTIISGGNTVSLAQAISAVLGVPSIEENGETVELVLTPPDVVEDVVVVTDKNTYKLPDGVTPESVGNSLLVGQFPTPDLRIYSGVNYSSKMEEDGVLVDLKLSPEWFDFEINGPLTFENQDKTVTVDDSGTVTTVRWDILGDTEDVDTFWAYVDQSALDGKSVARELSGPDRVEPMDEDIPDTINPAKWILGHVLPTATILYVNAEKIDVRESVERKLSKLYNLLPAHSPFLVLISRSGSTTIRYGSISTE